MSSLYEVTEHKHSDRNHLQDVLYVEYSTTSLTSPLVDPIECTLLQCTVPVVSGEFQPRGL